MATVLVTGGAGYIGSHTMVELLAAGHDVVCVDNLSNSSAEAVRRVAQIAGREPAFHEVDLRDAPALRQVLESEPIVAVLAVGGRRAVGDAVARPLADYVKTVPGGRARLGGVVVH